MGEGAPRARWVRWVGVALAIVVLIPIVAAYAWFVYLPGWRPALLAGERFGIDVSNHQGTSTGRR